MANSNRVYPPGFAENLAADYIAGMPVSDLVSKYHISAVTAYKYLHIQGVNTGRSKRGPARKRAMVSPYFERLCNINGLNYVDIAEKLGITHEYAYFVLAGYKPMSPIFAHRITEKTGWDGDRIYREASEWWARNGRQK